MTRRHDNRKIHQAGHYLHAPVIQVKVETANLHPEQAVLLLRPSSFKLYFHASRLQWRSIPSLLKFLVWMSFVLRVSLCLRKRIMRLAIQWTLFPYPNNSGQIWAPIFL